MAPRAARGRLALVLWALLLAAIVVILATWVAGEIAERQERDAVDSRLSANLAAGREEFADALRDAETRAERIAASERVQRALADRNEAAAQRIAGDRAERGARRRRPGARGRGLLAREPDGRRRGRRGEVVGSVVVGVPLDDELADRLARATALQDSDVLAIADEGRTLAASGTLEPGAALPTEQQGSTELADEAYRFVSTPLLEDTGVSLAVLSPEAPVAAAVEQTQRRAFFAALATVGLALLAAGTIAWAQRRRAAEAQAAAEEGPTGGGARATSAAAAMSAASGRPWRWWERPSPPRTTRRRSCR